MRILILKDLVPDAAAIKTKILADNPSFDSVTICESYQAALEQISLFGTHVIILNFTAAGTEEFISQVKDHPHRIINLDKNYLQDFFSARLLGLNQAYAPVRTIVAKAPGAEQFQHSPSLSI
ncbi:MAG: hypothetical protein QM764_20145 [Chitinophagaceae bacterium]